ncbi:MAG: hypothetical protein KDA24_24825, partial [Deltaproteobacteria bacterium]|nr:hypothetical protein [Deltaproteobacteria bacterium]
APTPAPFDEPTAVADRSTHEPDALAVRAPLAAPHAVADRAASLGGAPAASETLGALDLEPLDMQGVAPRKPTPTGYDTFNPEEDIADDLRDALQASLAGIPAVMRPPPEDPYAVAARGDGGSPSYEAHRTRVPVDDASVNFETGLVEAPSEDVFDAFGVAPRDGAPASPFGDELHMGADPLQLDESGLEEMERFAVAEREIAEAARLEPPPPPTPPPTPPPAPKKPARKPAKLRISYKKASTFIREYRKNIPRGGTVIKTKKPLSLGRECVLSLTVPGWETPVEIRGEVVWSSKGIEVEEGQDEGMGIKYDPEDVDGLAAAQDALTMLENQLTGSAPPL